MDGQQIHLIVNHVPVIGALWVLLLALVAYVGERPAVIRTALWFTVLLGISVLPAFLSGEPAEETISRLPGVSEPAIGRHEEMAEKALWITLATGVVALATLILRARRGGTEPLRRKTLLPTLVALFIAAGALGWTGHLGGMIHRPELRGDAGTPPRPAAAEPDHEGGEH